MGFQVLLNLKEVILPDNIIIGECKFSGCKKLEKVTFKGKIKAKEGFDPGIYPFTFSGCSSLKEIKLPSNVKFISEGAFRCCTKLEKITLPPKLELIGENAFEDCKSLKKITLPSTLKSIKKKAFRGCKSLEGKMKLPKKLEKVGDGAFAFCYGLTGFRIADGNKYFSQKGGVLFNKDKTKIYCYLSGKETKEYKMPSTVKSISEYSFVGTKHLKKLTFSDKVKRVPDVVFWKSNIRDIVFSKSVKKISDVPELDTLKSITVKNKNCEMPYYWGSFKGKKITVYGYKNSTAQKFAKKAKLKFVEIK
ncbi:MAG: leucine-rich repeat domain-containing protein [Oscillospiraceae bacterium]|nr:leucine-rich repeat domain-containing protein [Oscillospiraceae bacterium]